MARPSMRKPSILRNHRNDSRALLNLDSDIQGWVGYSRSSVHRGDGHPRTTLGDSKNSNGIPVSPSLSWQELELA